MNIFEGIYIVVIIVLSLYWIFKMITMKIY